MAPNVLADPAVVARMAYFQRQDRRPSLDELKAHVAAAIAKWGTGGQGQECADGMTGNHRCHPDVPLAHPAGVVFPHHSPVGCKNPLGKLGPLSYNSRYRVRSNKGRRCMTPAFFETLPQGMTRH